MSQCFQSSLIAKVKIPPSWPEDPVWSKQDQYYRMEGDCDSHFAAQVPWHWPMNPKSQTGQTESIITL
uniref:Uncharacterized protein n=1 Tax=Rhizophora mucronata TaxID=61149 RepID=A0A2P2N9L0_RHIMU